MIDIKWGRVNLVGDDSNNEVPSREKPVFAAEARTLRVVDNRVDSLELFGTAREIMIGHGGDVYRLRLTAQNKLILTK
jgi:hemin uptake protein HemP